MTMPYADPGFSRNDGVSVDGVECCQVVSSDLQAGGRRFDPVTAHTRKPRRRGAFLDTELHALATVHASAAQTGNTIRSFMSSSFSPTTSGSGSSDVASRVQWSEWINPPRWRNAASGPAVDSGGDAPLPTTASCAGGDLRHLRAGIGGARSARRDSRRGRPQSQGRGRVDAVRAVRGSEPRALPRVRRAVRALNLIRLEDDLYDAAVELEPPELRSLDAIHLAAALSLGPDLAGVVTYDRRLALRANGLGIRVKAPTRG
jgi:predicted nucleic acid-binding protein